MDKDNGGVVLGVIGVLAILSFAIWWNVSVWSECRENGSSFMYCWNMISRR